MGCEGGLSGGRVVRGAVVMAVVERPPHVAGGGHRQLVDIRSVANFQDNLDLGCTKVVVA